LLFFNEVKVKTAAAIMFMSFYQNYHN